MRFYFDADVLGLAKTVVRLRSDVTYPGDPGGALHRRERPACPITSPATPDSTWICRGRRARLADPTRDRHIRDHRREIQAVRDHDAPMVTLAGDEAQRTWNQLEVLMCQWRAIEEQIIDAPGPFISEPRDENSAHAA